MGSAATTYRPLLLHSAANDDGPPRSPICAQMAERQITRRTPRIRRRYGPTAGRLRQNQNRLTSVKGSAWPEPRLGFRRAPASSLAVRLEDRRHEEVVGSSPPLAPARPLALRGGRGTKPLARWPHGPASGCGTAPARATPKAQCESAALYIRIIIAVHGNRNERFDRSGCVTPHQMVAERTPGPRAPFHRAPDVSIGCGTPRTAPSQSGRDDASDGS